MANNKERVNVYELIQRDILSQLEKAFIPWEKPWHGTGNSAISHATGKPYSLLNQCLLNKPGEYLTFKQAQQEGGHVKKGEKASMVVFWKVVPTKVTDKNGDEKEKLIPVLRYYSVFHIDQCEGIKPRITEEKPIVTASPDDVAESIVSSYVERECITFENVKGNEAFYSPARDCVVVPLMEQFSNTSEYYGTVFHELTHSTGHEKRLNRIDKKASFGSEDYGREELVAEMGACTLLNHCGLSTNKTNRNTAAYIQSWMQAIKKDSRLFVTAASRAEKAVNLILGGESNV